MWKINEHKSLTRACKRIPPQVLKKYELWKNILFRHGPEKLNKFPGFQDEMLTGKRKGQRASRLNKQYRVIYTVEDQIVTVYVLEITLHKY